MRKFVVCEHGARRVDCPPCWRLYRRHYAIHSLVKNRAKMYERARYYRALRSFYRDAAPIEIKEMAWAGEKNHA